MRYPNSMLLSDYELTMLYIDVLDKWQEWAREKASGKNDTQSWNKLLAAIQAHEKRFEEVWNS